MKLVKVKTEAEASSSKPRIAHKLDKAAEEIITWKLR
jgi:hypothetical protein